jgi:hypothetical protein
MVVVMEVTVEMVVTVVTVEMVEMPRPVMAAMPRVVMEVMVEREELAAPVETGADRYLK